MREVLVETQSRFQSPRYPYPAAGTGNKDLWDNPFRPLSGRIIPEVFVARSCCWMLFQALG